MHFISIPIERPVLYRTQRFARAPDLRIFFRCPFIFGKAVCLIFTLRKPDILECEVKWALGSIIMNKARGGDGIPVELFQILKDDAVKVLHSICQQIWKPQQWSQDWKRSVFIPTPKKGNAKICSNYRTILLISHAGKVMLKILQARLQQYVNHDFQMFKLDLEKAEELEIKLPTSLGLYKKQENSRKHLLLLH